MKRRITAFGLTAALLFAPLSAMAADAQAAPQSDLAPGPAAGVQKAQGMVLGTAGYVVIGVAAVALVVVAASGGGGGGHTVTTSTSGAP